MLAAPLFYGSVLTFLNWGIIAVYLVLMLWAIIHVLTQRPDKFAALGGFQKNHWLLLLGGLLIGTPLVIFFGRFYFFIGIGAAAYYLLETRRGLKDVSEGHW
ncbi:DUF2516 family protein [Catelliglobosispora koreensis]|uniref:DUF2516 family protein n=1 Tax=Catelliglobosispora koreensis TaxID=129052 RepID=UPI00037B921E|nr:DUF2516 family protein [Catelliglobosispora koreensis]